MSLYQVLIIFIISGSIPTIYYYIKNKKDELGASLAFLGVVVALSLVLIFAKDIIILFK
ncbi:hypothetical protein AB3Z07_28260 (plasmid) [Metabacillus halosaccharovorans]|uniref:hypothetical protein n=1 Tax=Metabacillus halosaccharovorans TaxID=930124 RepID=UPI001C1FD38B|nr:hypothetical protein [Metabacillus halosaccharovorans]